MHHVDFLLVTDQSQSSIPKPVTKNTTISLSIPVGMKIFMLVNASSILSSSLDLIRNWIKIISKPEISWGFFYAFSEPANHFRT